MSTEGAFSGRTRRCVLHHARKARHHCTEAYRDETNCGEFHPPYKRCRHGKNLEMAVLPRWGTKPVAHESLFHDAGCAIDKYNGVVWMNTNSAWSDRHKALAQKHKVTHIHLCTASFGAYETAEFLLDFPDLRGLTIRLYAVKDLSKVGQLPQLEYLRIHLEARRLGDRFNPVDFSALSKLQSADVMMCRAFESILTCSSIQELAIENAYDGRLRDIDLSHLPKLRDLKLDHCPKLRKVTLHKKARIRALQLTLCGSYEADWHRLAPDLRFLLLGGRIRFPLEHIVSARISRCCTSTRFARIRRCDFSSSFLDSKPSSPSRRRQERSSLKTTAPFWPRSRRAVSHGDYLAANGSLSSLSIACTISWKLDSVYPADATLILPSLPTTKFRGMNCSAYLP